MRGAIFDMDGTLCDSEPFHTEAWLKVMEQNGREFTPDWFEGWSGKTEESLAEYIAANYDFTMGGDELLFLKRSIYRKIVHGRLKAFAGLPEEIERLELAGVSTVLCTSSNNDDALNTLNCIGLFERFPKRVTCNDVDRHKPEPDPFIRAAEMIGLPPEECFAFEDSPAGVKSAKDAGCTVLGVTTSHDEQALSFADCIFPTTAEAVRWALDNR